MLSSIETLKANDALDVLSQLKKSDTDDGAEAIVELLNTSKAIHVDDIVLVERLGNAVRVLESVKVTKTLVKASKSIEQAVSFLKTERKFSEELINKQFFNLFEASTEVKKLNIAQIDNIKLEGLNYFITGNYDELYKLFKKYKINYDAGLQDVWPPFNGL